LARFGTTSGSGPPPTRPPGVGPSARDDLLLELREPGDHRRRALRTLAVRALQLVREAQHLAVLDLIDHLPVAHRVLVIGADVLEQVDEPARGGVGGGRGGRARARRGRSERDGRAGHDGDERAKHGGRDATADRAGAETMQHADARLRDGVATRQRLELARLTR
jgi:hypothetical protein